MDNIDPGDFYSKAEARECDMTFDEADMAYEETRRSVRILVASFTDPVLNTLLEVGSPLSAGIHTPFSARTQNRGLYS